MLVGVGVGGRDVCPDSMFLDAECHAEHGLSADDMLFSCGGLTERCARAGEQGCRGWVSRTHVQSNCSHGPARAGGAPA